MEEERRAMYAVKKTKRLLVEIFKPVFKVQRNTKHKKNLTQRTEKEMPERPWPRDNILSNNILSQFAWTCLNYPLSFWGPSRKQNTPFPIKDHLL